MRLCEQRAQMLRRGAGRKEVTLQRAVLRETFLVVFHRNHDPDARLVLHGDVPGAGGSAAVIAVSRGSPPHPARCGHAERREIAPTASQTGSLLPMGPRRAA